MTDVALPPGLSWRPARMDDAETVAALVADCETFALGAAESDVDDVRSDWQRPSVDLAADTVLVFDAGGTMLRVTTVQKVAAAQYTVLGWQVEDIAATVKVLQKAGVKFERFEGMPQDELGVWTAPGGAKIAWFKDPDGNMLSVTEF